jgi:hypothetical protein
VAVALCAVDRLLGEDEATSRPKSGVAEGQKVQLIVRLNIAIEFINFKSANNFISTCKDTSFCLVQVDYGASHLQFP